MICTSPNLILLMYCLNNRTKIHLALGWKALGFTSQMTNYSQFFSQVKIFRYFLSGAVVTWIRGRYKYGKFWWVQSSLPTLTWHGCALCSKSRCRSRWPYPRFNWRVQKDPRTDKINLGVGIYKNEAGETPVLATVKKQKPHCLSQRKPNLISRLKGQLSTV